ncbi:MAG TPA: carbohydrate ABC transporter permease [Trebonia sp.]
MTATLNVTAPLDRSRQARRGGRIRRIRPGSVVAFLVLLIVSLAWVVPLAWTVDTSLKPEAQTATIPPTWSSPRWTIDAYLRVLDNGNLSRWFLNSAVTSVVITAGTVLLASLAGYALSRIRFRGRTMVFWLIMAGIMIPIEALVVPLFYEVNSLNMVDTYWGIILPQLASPVSVFIFKQYFDGIPREFEEAAVMDGASQLRVYWRVMMPLSMPAVATVAILSFIASWNNFLWPLIAITGNTMMTIPVGLSTVQGAYGLQYAQIMASTVLAALPMLVVFGFFQRQIVEGVSGGLK